MQLYFESDFELHNFLRAQIALLFKRWQRVEVAGTSN